METEISPLLRATVAQSLRVEEAKVTSAAHLTRDLGADSLERIGLILAVEEEFGIEIHDDDIDDLVTVGDVMRLVDRSAPVSSVAVRRA